MKLKYLVLSFLALILFNSSSEAASKILVCSNSIGNLQIEGCGIRGCLTTISINDKGPKKYKLKRTQHSDGSLTYSTKTGTRPRCIVKISALKKRVRKIKTISCFSKLRNSPCIFVNSTPNSSSSSSISSQTSSSSIESSSSTSSSSSSSSSPSSSSLNSSSSSSREKFGTKTVVISGNIDAAGDTTDTFWPTTSLAGATGAVASFSDIENVSEYFAIFTVIDSLKGMHQLTIYFNKIAVNVWTVRIYTASDDVDTVIASSGLPRQITSPGGSAVNGTFTLYFDSDGEVISSSTSIVDFAIPWNNGSTTSASQTIKIDLSRLNQYFATSSLNILVN